MFRSKHSGWTWEGKRTPFGGGGGSSGAGPKGAGPFDANTLTGSQMANAISGVVQQTNADRARINGASNISGGKGSSVPVSPYTQQQAPQQQIQQPTPVSPFVQQQRQQMMQQQMPQMGLGYQQPGLQSMLARILGMGGGGYGMPPQMMQQGMPPQMPQQGYGMPAYGQYGMNQNPLGYRPDMSRVYQNLSNVRPSIQKQNQDAQAARIADLEAQLARYNTPSGE